MRVTYTALVLGVLMSIYMINSVFWYLVKSNYVVFVTRVDITVLAVAVVAVLVAIRVYQKVFMI